LKWVPSGGGGGGKNDSHEYRHHLACRGATKTKGSDFGV
jgi:hypothetical protein